VTIGSVTLFKLNSQTYTYIYILTRSLLPWCAVPGALRGHKAGRARQARRALQCAHTFKPPFLSITKTHDPTFVCKDAYAFKRAAPFSYTDQTGWCYLLQNAGGCKLADFSAELLTRQIESERQCSASAPGLDNPVCIGIPSTRDDARVLDHADAAAIAYEVPYDRYPAPGSRGLPLPRTQVEAMSMIAYARVNGVTAFWGANPNTDAGDVRMVHVKAN